MSKLFKIYCLSYNNPERKQTMQNKFQQLDVNYEFYDGVNFSDLRIHPMSYKQCWSCMYGHLDMIQMFYDDITIDYGVFCEDDIYIHKNFKQLMPQVIDNFENLNLDVLLLGYLLPFKAEHYNNFHLKNDKIPNSEFQYFNFPNDVWGAQMYMLSKENAKKILDKYSEPTGYAIKTLTDNSLPPFSADWTITKDGNRALISPCLAVENGKTESPDNSQRNYHKCCHEAHYNPDLFI